MRIPDKHYFKIGEVAELAGVEPYVIRYWESEFRSLRPQKSRSNQRLFRRKDVERILEIRRLLYEEGYKIEGARRRLEGQEEPESPESGDGKKKPERSVAALRQLCNEARATVTAIEKAYQGGTFPSPLARQSLASLPPPRVPRATWNGDRMQGHAYP